MDSSRVFMRNSRYVLILLVLIVVLTGGGTATPLTNLFRGVEALLGIEEGVVVDTAASADQDRAGKHQGQNNAWSSPGSSEEKTSHNPATIIRGRRRSVRLIVQKHCYS